MKKCPECKVKSDTESDECPECGAKFLSVDDARLDDMVAAASIPNLASLFKQGKKAGLIKPSQEYGQSA